MTRQVETSSIAGSVPELDMSLWGLVMQADMVVKSVMVMLLLASVWCWAIVFDKSNLLRRTKKKSNKFEKEYSKAEKFTPLYYRVNNKPDNPLAAMFATGMQEIKNQSNFANGEFNQSSAEGLRERVYFAIQRVKNLSIEKLQKDLIFLATIGSTAPFIGLFGTVWGIVNSFQAIAVSKNTTLAVVAPGIAEALLATAIGLFAAIPAVVYYNILSNKIRALSDRFEDFSNELSTVLVRSAIDGKEGD